MAGVEIENVRGLGVEHKANWPVAILLLLEHHARDVITVTKIVTEALAVFVEENATLTTKS
jgi:hypothetical protein